MSERPQAAAASEKDQLPSVSILGVPVHKVTMEDTLREVERLMDEARLHQIVTLNPEFVMAAQEDVEFKQILSEADLCIPDGVGLLLASRWKGQPMPERVAGSDLVYRLARQAAGNGWRLFLLGAGSGVAEEAAEVLKRLNPELIIAGTYAGSPDPAENDPIVKLVNESRADLLYVAYGAPKQDKWIYRNRQALETVRVAIGIGGSLDFITGQAVRAPRWVQRMGMEWLHRLYKEPWRWRRMRALPNFAYKVIRE